MWRRGGSLRAGWRRSARRSWRRGDEHTKGDKVDSRRRAAAKATAEKVLSGRRLALAARGLRTLRKSSGFANETRRATQRVRALVSRCKPEPAPVPPRCFPNAKSGQERCVYVRRLALCL